MTTPEGSAKPVTRRALRAARAGRRPEEAAAVAAALAGHVAGTLRAHLRAGTAAPDEPAATSVAPVAPVAPVAAYVSLPGEPGTGPLRAALRAAGHPVLLPVLLPDLDLAWVLDDGPGDGPDPLRPGGDRLGPEALGRCAVVLVPALAVDRAGTRLGQGGGSYDRVLGRLAGGPGRPLVLAVVHDEELVAGPLPREPHDVGVDGVLAPAGLVLLPGHRQEPGPR